jgi:hypothetical protein
MKNEKEEKPMLELILLFLCITSHSMWDSSFGDIESCCKIRKINKKGENDSLNPFRGS